MPELRKSKKQIIQRQNNENNKNHRFPGQNNENHENLIIPR